MAAVLVSQYIEYSYYGGVGRSDRAGKCKIKFDPNKKRTRRRSSFFNSFQFWNCFRKQAKIHTSTSAEGLTQQDMKKSNQRRWIWAPTVIPSSIPFLSRTKKADANDKKYIAPISGKGDQGWEDDNVQDAFRNGSGYSHEGGDEEYKDTSALESGHRMSSVIAPRSAAASTVGVSTALDAKNFANLFDEEDKFMEAAIQEQKSQENLSNVTSLESDVSVQKPPKKPKGKPDLTAVPGLAGGFLFRKEMEKNKVMLETKAAALEARRAREARVTEWLEWKCIVCGKENRRPKYPPTDYDIYFTERGERYKRDVATLVAKPRVPHCDHCMTPSNYKAPLCTTHLFPHHPDPEKAFRDYPTLHALQHGLPKRNRGSLGRLRDKLVQLLFGVRDNIKSMSLTYDWRLRLYLSSRFPEVPRPVMVKDPGLGTVRDLMGNHLSNEPTLSSDLSKYEQYEVGEPVECRLQRADWSRAKITVSHFNHTYDIRCVGGLPWPLLQPHRHSVRPCPCQYATVMS